MLRTKRRPRPSRGWREQRWERLEPRFVLSDVLGPNLSIIATDPAPDSRLTTAVSSLAFTFDRQVFDGSVGFDDFQLDQVASDGTLTPLIDPNVGAFESLDSTQTQLTVDLDSVLTPGHYRMFLSGLNALSGLDGSVPAGNGTDQPLGDFTIVNPGVTLDGATNLGRIGSSAKPTTVAGKLDFTANPFAVDLYKFTLTDDHTWRFGAELSAQRNGSPLLGALSLFDSKGQPISVTTFGRPGFPSDPYFFKLLGPGTYYIGVSGVGNAAGQPGAYNPVTGDPGLIGQTQPGGPYTLRLAADPGEAPVALLGFRLDHADPQDTTPTGFELQFSGSISLAAADGSLSNAATNGVQVVDQKGRTWPIAAVRYDEATASLTYLFRAELPVGRYSVELPSTGGLVDLAGHLPTAAGMPPGILATFTVFPNPRPAGPTDFGPLFPASALAGVSKDATIQPGQAVDFHATILYPNFYLITTRFSGGPVTNEIQEHGVTVATIKPSKPDLPQTVFKSLPAGDYVFHVTDTGAAPAHFELSYKVTQFSWESLLQNGVGQGPALNLMLISPMGSLSPVTPATSLTSDRAPGGAAIAPLPNPGTASIAGGVSPSPGFHDAPQPGGAAPIAPLPGSTSTATGLPLTPGGVLVGQPASLSGFGSPGGAGESAVTGDAAASGSALAGIGYGVVDRISIRPRDTGDANAVSAPIDGAIVARADNLEPLPATPKLNVNPAATAGMSLVDRLLMAWENLPGMSALETTSGATPNVAATAGDDTRLVPPRVVTIDTEPVQEAGFSHPIGIGLIALLVFQTRDRLGRWLGQSKRQRRSVASIRAYFLERGTPS
jgi:hypothetical protein